jgi:energy-coupling factor transporter transmembrane protein EcfT
MQNFLGRKIKPIIPLVLLLLLGIFLFIVVEDFVQSVIVVPLLYIIWFVTLVIESLPQGSIWFGFVLVLLIFAYLSLRSKNTNERTYHPSLSYKTGPVEKWARLLENAEMDTFTKWRLANQLKRFNRRLVSVDKPEKSNNLLDDEKIPADILSFYEAKAPTRIPFWEWLNTNEESLDPALDLDPELVIEYLEKRLEI